MIPLVILRKILFSLVPLALFYLLRKIAKGETERKSQLPDFDKSQIIEGEIVEEK